MVKITNTVLGSNAVGTVNIIDGAVTDAKLASGAVTEDKIGANAVTSAKLGSSAVGTTAIADGAVTAAKLASDAVTTVKVQDAAVTGAKIATGGVGTTNLADSAVATAKIADGAVTGSKLGSNAVATGNIADSAVTLAKLGVSPVLQGYHTVWIPAKAFTSSSVNGATPVDYGFSSSSKPTFGGMTFGKSLATYADVAVAWPKSWDKGNVTFSVYYVGDTTTGSVVWGVAQLQATSSTSVNAAYTYVTTVTSSCLTVGNIVRTSEMSVNTGAVLGSGGDDGVGFFQLYRAVSNPSDTMTGAAVLVGVLMRYNVSGVNDA